MLEPPRKALVYLDHSALSAAVKGWLPLPCLDHVLWVYSDEHFKEIKRSKEPNKYLNLLQEIKAARAEIVLDENLEFSEQCKLIQGSDPHGAYESYSNNLNDTELDDDIFIQIILQFSGAANSTSALIALGNLEKEVSRLSEGVLAVDAKDQAVLAYGLKHDFTILDLRRVLGTEQLHLNSSLDENVIRKIWSLISEKFPGVSIDQFFGFSSTVEDGVKFAPFTGILRCYLMLNILGYFPDNDVRKKHGLTSALSDGNHTAYSAYCDGFLSLDEKAVRKARAIYEYLGWDRSRVGHLVRN